MTRKISLALASAILCMGVTQAFADDHDTSQESYFNKRFQLNGYISLGFADLDIEGNRAMTGNEAILGIPEDGTFTYGNAALLLRYMPTERHTFLLQLSARKLGDSLLEDAENAIELDWLYYQFEAGANTRLRLGRLPAPAGIFNEIRDVGVLLPFYRPSYVFYREGSIFSETVDGVAVSHRFASESQWSLDADLYFGEFDVLEQSVGFDEGMLSEVGARDAFGLQFWLETPVDDLRLGLGGQRWVVGAESRFNFQSTTWRSVYASMDWNAERFVARGEYRVLYADSQSSPSAPFTEARTDYYYLQLGFHANERWSFFVQPEKAEISQRGEAFLTGRSDFDERQDLGVAVNYRPRQNLVLKAEYHWVNAEIPRTLGFVPSPDGPRLLRTLDSFDSNYAILSASLSF